MNVPDIPKIYTALAEWFSCCVFVLALEKRYKKMLYNLCIVTLFYQYFVYCNIILAYGLL